MEKEKKKNKIVEYLKDLVSLSSDMDTVQAAANIRSNIPFKGTTVYILAIAVVIASVGLNVNSIPVIIGAMLISPLMGPIFGFALSLGTNDMDLLLQSLKNLGVMVAISILASTLYFLVTPLDLQHPTELLARTNPTIYDVLIAFFGGLAGLLETSRKEKGTVMSGVAIATALMPPLCTVGFGIATGQWLYALGALYLFFINTMFITLAGFIVVKYLGYPMVTLSDGNMQRRRNMLIFIIMLIVIVPSILSAVKVVQENNEGKTVTEFIDGHKSLGKSFIYDSKVSTKGRWFKRQTDVELYYAGESLSNEEKARIIKEADELGLNLRIFDDAASQYLSEKDIVNMIYEQSEARIEDLEKTVTKLEDSLAVYSAKELPARQLTKEIKTQIPIIERVSFARAETVAVGSEEKVEEVLVLVEANGHIGSESLEKLENWLKARLSTENVRVIRQ